MCTNLVPGLPACERLFEKGAASNSQKSTLKKTRTPKTSSLRRIRAAQSADNPGGDRFLRAGPFNPQLLAEN